MASTWRFAASPMPEDFQPDECAGCRDWLREQRDVREANARLARARNRPAPEEHTHG